MVFKSSFGRALRPLMDLGTLDLTRLIDPFTCEDETVILILS